MAKSNFPQAIDTIKPIHKLSTLPLKLLGKLNLGPLGGDNSISVIIETVLAKKRGEEPDYKLSKTESFFVKQLVKSEIPDEMIEYRDLSFEAQDQLIKQYGHERLGIIWIGAGIFSLKHPLLNLNSEYNWNIWTDSSPKVVHGALKAFSQMQEKGKTANLSHTINLPEDGNRLAEWIHFLGDHVDRIIIMGYGLTYALTPKENLSWLKQIESVELKLPLAFVFNSPSSKIDFLPGLMAAYHDQRMMYYTNEHIQSLFAAAFQKSTISWYKKREDTRNKIWGTWIIEVAASS